MAGHTKSSLAAEQEHLKARIAAGVPLPPDYLCMTKDETKIWTEILRSLPHGWIEPQAYPMFACLCRLTLRSRQIAAWLPRLQAKGDALGYKAVYQTEKSAAREIAMLSSRLRLKGNTDQARKHRREINKKISGSLLAHHNRKKMPANTVVPWLTEMPEATADMEADMSPTRTETNPELAAARPWD